MRVGHVGAFEPCEILLAQPVEPKPALLGLGVRRHRTGARDFAGKLRMATQEGQLLVSRRAAQGPHHCAVHLRHRGERPRRIGTLRDPWRMLEHIADGGNECGAIACVQLIKAYHGRILASR